MKKEGEVDRVLWTLLNIGVIVLTAVGGIVLAAVFEHFGLEDLFWKLVVLGICLPFVFDLFQGNQVRLFRGAHGMGICETLQEDAYLVALFVEDRESSWSQEEIDAFMKNCVGEAAAFLEKQAAKYGHDLMVGFGYYQENGQAKILSYDGKIAADKNIGNTMVRNLGLLGSGARELGYGSARQMLNSDRKTTEKDQISYLICVNKPGRSYALSDGSDKYFLRGTEFAVIYSSYPGGEVKTTATAVAHETLHMFGAEDYYTDGKENMHRSEMAESLCPTDIMLCKSADIRQQSVEAFTAYTVGWLDAYPQAYKKLDWWR